MDWMDIVGGIAFLAAIIGFIMIVISIFVSLDNEADGRIVYISGTVLLSVSIIIFLLMFFPLVYPNSPTLKY